MDNLKYTIRPEEYAAFIIELKLHINTKLYEKGVITEEMYIKAKEVIIRQAA